MHLVQILLPLFDNDGNAFPQSVYQHVSEALTEKYNGLTAFNRTPAEGKWKTGDKQITKDEIIIFEVMCKDLDKSWWRDYCVQLETIFRQEHVVIRSHPMEIL